MTYTTGCSFYSHGCSINWARNCWVQCMEKFGRLCNWCTNTSLQICKCMLRSGERTHSQPINQREFSSNSFVCFVRCRIICDAAQTPSTKTKIAQLKFLTDLATTYCTAAEFPTQPPADKAATKVVHMAVDQKSLELRNQARSCLIALYNCNTPNVRISGRLIHFFRLFKFPFCLRFRWQRFSHQCRKPFRTLPGRSSNNICVEVHLVSVVD